MGDGVHLGYRLYIHKQGAPVILFHHGNGETAPDYDHIAPYFQRIVGASLLVVDFRGYGWSSGRPTFTSLIGDTEPLITALPGILAAATLTDSPLYLMGRSMGSAPTVHLAYTHPEHFKGVILESGFADLLSVMVRLGYPGHLLGNLIDPVGNERKIASVTLPLLLIHGAEDTLIPVQHAERMLKASGAGQKRFLKVPGAGHNNLLAVALREYFSAIAELISTTPL